MPENTPPILLRDLSQQLKAIKRRSIRIETKLMRLIEALGYTAEGMPITDQHAETQEISVRLLN